MNRNDSEGLVDLSWSLRDGLVTDPRLPVVAVRDVWTRGASAANYADGVSFQIASATVVQNSGTYIDCPFHRHDGMGGTWDYPLARTADLGGVVVDARGGGERAPERFAMDRELFEGVDVGGRAVLMWTGWDALWQEDGYRAGAHPYLTEAAAELLVERGAVLYGVDTLNADDFTDKGRPAHTVLLGADVAIVENLRGLGALHGEGFRFTASPVKVEGCGSFPVRAWARVVRGAC